MTEITSLTGPLEKVDDRLVLRIPLEAGGDKLAESCRGISRVEDGFLCVEIMDWLALQLEISEGSLVTVHNTDGKFNITRVAPE